MADLRPEHIPDELKAHRQWVCWRLVERKGRKPTKRPICPNTGRQAGTTSPETWGTYEEAFAAYVHEGYDGLGFVFTAADPFFGVDLDDCLNGDVLSDDAQAIVERLDTYTERTPGLRGAHAIGQGALPGPGRCDLKRGREIYDRGRYFTVTGHVLGGRNRIRHCNGAAGEVYRAYWPERALPGAPGGFGGATGALEALSVPPWVKQLVHVGEGLERYDGDRSRALMAVCCSMVYHDVSGETICEILTDPRHFLAHAALERRGGDVESARQWVLDYNARPAAAVVGDERVREVVIRPPVEPRSTEDEILPPSVRQFLELDFPPLSPLLGPISTQQIVILYAPPGAGKTMFGLNLGWALGAGRDLIGWTSHRRARVLVVDGEMAGEMMQERLAHAGIEDGYLRIANLPNWGAQQGYEPVNLCTEMGQAVVDAWAERAGSEVLILDNLMSLAWLDGVSMSSDEFWQPIRRFAVMQRSKGRTVVVIDHTNAAGEIFGTKTKLWHADLGIQLSKVDEEEPDSGLKMHCPRPRFRLKFAKVRGTPDSVGQSTAEKVITMGVVGQDWDYEVGDDELKRRAREMKINGISIRDIAEELRKSKSWVGRVVKGL